VRSSAGLLATGAILLAAAAAGCQYDTGDGEVTGQVLVRYCEKDKALWDSRVEEKDGTYKLSGDSDPGQIYMAGEPFEDVREPPRANRLVIRLQRSGKRIESNDVLTFDIVDSYEVARCMRGATVRGSDGVVRPDYLESFCTRVTPSSPPRLRVGANLPIRAYFTPRSTCPNNVTTVASAVARLEGGSGAWESWIELEKFGSARLPGNQVSTEDDPSRIGCKRRSAQEVAASADAAAPDDARPAPDGGAANEAEDCPDRRRGFRVEFGEPLFASRFELTLVDDRVNKGVKIGDVPVKPEIEAVLKGWFEFKLTRGQGAQTFP
jgi:hypothetical protein